MTRTRSCNNPPPQRGGKECPGKDTDTSFDCESPCPGKSLCCIERFSLDCRKTKTKVNTLANQRA